MSSLRDLGVWRLALGLCLALLGGVSDAGGQTLSLNSSTSDLTLSDCDPLVFAGTHHTTYHGTWKYEWTLFRNNVAIKTKRQKISCDKDFPCELPFFSHQPPTLAGTYRVRLRVTKTFLGLFKTTAYSGYSNSISVSLNLPSTTMFESTSVVLGDGSGVHDEPALVGDVNGDGRDDLVFVGEGWSGAGLNVRVKRSDGDGTYTQISQVLGDGAGIHAYPTLTGDVTGDGRMDLIFIGQDWTGDGLNVRVKRGNPNGTFTSLPYQVLGDGAGVHEHPALVGDVNGDERADLVFIGQDWQSTGLNVRVKLGQADGTFMELPYQLLGDGDGVHEYPTLIGDVNGDARMDMVFVGQGWNGAGLNVRVKLGQTSGQFLEVPNQVLGDGPDVHDHPTLVGDVNNDDRMDLIFIGQAWQGSGLNVRVKLGQPSGLFAELPYQVLGDGPAVHDHPAHVGDVNGDGRDDLVFVYDSCGGSRIRVKHANADGTWGNAEQVLGDGAGVFANPVLSGDVNDDDRLDVLFMGQGWSGVGLNIRTRMAD